MLSHSQLFPLLSNGLGRVGALMAENSVAAVWVTNDPKVREYLLPNERTMGGAASGCVGSSHSTTRLLVKWRSLTGCRCACAGARVRCGRAVAELGLRGTPAGSTAGTR